jgi:hypothetical protein
MESMLLVLALALQDLPKPAPEHGWLRQFEGTWETKSKFVMDPSQPPSEGKGTATYRMICDGLWLVGDYHGEMTGLGKFSGHGILGYDLEKKKFIGCWVDNFITRFDFSEGEGSEKSIALVTETPQGKLKLVYDVKDKDFWTLSFYGVQEGKDHLMGSVEYRRKK